MQWNGLWAELLGDPAALDTRARNLIWRYFTGGGDTAAESSRVERDAAHADTFEREMVADLRRAADRYPDDRAAAELTAALREANPRFAELWSRYEAVPNSPSRKTVVHPELGPITLDCDVLTIDGSDLRIVLYSAVPGSRDEELLDRLRSRSGAARLMPASSQGTPRERP